MRQRNYYGALMVHEGAADGMVTGLTTGYADAIHAPLEVIHTQAGRRAAGVYIPALCALIAPWLAHPQPLHGYLIDGHGLYAWGRDLAEARRLVERNTLRLARRQETWFKRFPVTWVDGGAEDLVERLLAVFRPPEPPYFGSTTE